MKEYFSHDFNARNDKRLINLHMKLGLEGIGAFWCIVEMLYEESGYLNIKEYERITFELRSNEKLIKSVIFEFDLFQNDGVKFWSDSILERLKLRMSKSEKARQSVEKRWKKYERNTNVLDSNNERNTSKVKKSKVKESKINIIDIDEIYSLYPSKCPTRKTSTGKSSKDKDKIKSILSTKTSNELIGIIEKYVEECTKNKIYMKNFSTFLNNLPDFSDSSNLKSNKFNYDDYVVPSHVWFGLSSDEIKTECLKGTYPLKSSLYKK